MQFERLRKSYRKSIIIGVVAICVIGGALTFNLTRAKYEVAEDLELAKGTINYKAYDFKIMAIYKSDDKTNYTEIEEMPSEGYTINEEKSHCNMSNGNEDTTAILKTIDGNHIISKLKKNDRCYLYFDKKLEPSEETLAKLNITNINSKIPDFSQIATTDEGIFKIEDEMYGGASYYWRGAATTNYVKFANFCWRIIRINGDGTLRLIYDGNICHQNGESTADSIATSNVQYNINYNQSNYVGWTYVGTSQRTISGTTSNAKSQTDGWFSANITGTNAAKVEQGKYCNDRNVGAKLSTWNGTWSTIWSATGTSFAYAAIDRVWNEHQPTLACYLADIYMLNAGLITLDEVVLAGGNFGNNTAYYLFNGKSFWTMTPSNWGNGVAQVFRIDMNGFPDWFDVNTTSVGIRPVINLRSDVTFSGGDGTLNNPYIVAD